MKCYVECDIAAVIIEVPDFVALRIKKYRNQFLDWMYNKNNKHKYWTKGIDSEGKEFVGVCYDVDAFVEWLNERIIKGKYESAKVIERDLDYNDCPEGMIRIFF